MLGQARLLRIRGYSGHECARRQAGYSRPMADPMSLILDALSRAERDKREQAAATPGILSQASFSVTQSDSRRFWALGLAAFLGLTTLAYVFWELSKSAPLPPVAATDTSSPRVMRSQLEPDVMANNAKVGALRAQIPQSPSPEVQASSAAIAALYAEAPQQFTGGAENKRRPANGGSNKIVNKTLKEIKPLVDGASDASQKDVDTSEPAAKELIDVERVLREMRGRKTKEALVAHATPLLDDLSKQFRDRVPTLMYSFHDYTPSGRSRVIINGDTLASGQRTRGVEVLEILPDSVILRFESTDFRLRSLNSWVNL